MIEPKVTGRILKISAATRKRNPELFGGGALTMPTTLAATVPPEKPKTRIRQSSKPLMNKLETRAKAWIELRYGIGIYTQAIRWRLGNGIWYKPDFALVNFDRQLICFEVKGPHAFRGGFENLKVAAGLYPLIWWRLLWEDNGQWQEQTILP